MLNAVLQSRILSRNPEKVSTPSGDPCNSADISPDDVELDLSVNELHEGFITSLADDVLPAW